MRQTSPAPGVHARNLFHLSVAMWDAWAAFDPQADGYISAEKMASDNVPAARDAAISYAAYGLIKHRYVIVGPLDPASEGLENSMRNLCFDPAYTSTTDDNPAALGNRIAAAVIDFGSDDGARENDGYADATYVAVNDPLVIPSSGTRMANPNGWQPLRFLELPTDQGGRPLGSPLQGFVGAGWGHVIPFALARTRRGVPIDPGPPPRLGDASEAELKNELVELIGLSSQLDPAEQETIDISPGAMGNNPLGTNDGSGYAVNPFTHKPYASDIVNRADFQRALAEFWADGPSSETPPGHWNVIANAAADAPGFTFQFGGIGPALDRLEWDVKMYLAVNGAVHDAAIAAWGLKRIYNSARPISLIRYMAGLGQSSEPASPAYDPEGLPLVDGLIELVTAESSQPGERHAALGGHVGEVAVRAWRGFPASTFSEIAGVDWILGADWVPYQRISFVSPAFPGFVSGHSTFSRAAAEVLTAMTGNEFFPGGLQTWTTHIGELRHELGPSADITLQWATYYDAADLAGMSRRFMGIHIAADDVEGRWVGSTCGIGAWSLATAYFDGSARP